jgi:phosphohistidine swiveling domain-containing protein
MESDVNAMIFDKEQFDAFGNYLADKMLNDSVWRKNGDDEHRRYMRVYFKAAERLRELNPSTMSDKDIAKEFGKLLPLQEKVRILGTTLNGLPLDGRAHLSNKLRGELRALIGDDEKFDEHWALLSHPTKPSMRQKKDLEIAKLAEASKKLSPEKTKALLTRLYEQYCWLDYMYYGPPASFESFMDELDAAKANNKNLHLKEHLAKISQDQRRLMEKLKFNRRAKLIVSIAQRVLWQKGWRKDVEYHGFYCYEPLLREIAKRRDINDWRDLLFLLPWELKGFILKGGPTTAEIRQRRGFSCLICTPNEVKMMSGDAARQFYRSLNLENNVSETGEIRGQSAYPGKVSGIVRIVHVPEEMGKVSEGDVLVSQATSPDLLPAIRKAAALVTNTGGLICNAAITARELKIPCIVGTRNATATLKDGDFVEVDANIGVVRKLKQ